jgi:hypothetical protein
MKKKKPPKKLELRHGTLRQLCPPDLARAGGGAMTAYADDNSQPGDAPRKFWTEG